VHRIDKLFHTAAALFSGFAEVYAKPRCGALIASLSEASENGTSRPPLGQSASSAFLVNLTAGLTNFRSGALYSGAACRFSA
jgi:hypothetical protein